MFSMSFYFMVIIGDNQKGSSPCCLGSSNILEADFGGKYRGHIIHGFNDVTFDLSTVNKYSLLPNVDKT